jgi:hypothetical protein
MPDKPVTHGIEHRPSSYDPIITDPWTYVSSGATAWSSGTTYNAGSSDTSGDVVQQGNFVYRCTQKCIAINPGVNTHWARYWHIVAPVFQNSWANSGGTLAAMRYKLSVGPPHVTDESNGSVIDLSDHQIEIQGSVTGGADGTVVFTLPPAYAPDADLRLNASDDTGLFVVMQVLATGDVIRGL